MNRYRWLDSIPSSAGEAAIFRFPIEELKARWNQPHKQVCVVGAGIAGLTAAYELARAGHEVVLVESDDRIGGRIRTWSTVHDGYRVTGEFGPMRIPPNHGGTLYYAEQLVSKPVPFVQHNPNGWLYLRGQPKVRLSDWSELMSSYSPDPDYLFPGLRFDLLDPGDPEGLIQQVLQHAKSTLTRDELWRVLTGDLGPAGRALGSMNLWQLAMGMHADLSGRGGPWLSTLPGSGRPSSIPPFRWFSSLGWEFVGRATGNLWEERIGALEACVEDIAVNGTLRWRLDEGMEAIPKAMERELRDLGGRIDIGTLVTRIEVQPELRRVRVFAGDTEILPSPRAQSPDHFGYVVCAVPAAASARIQFSQPLAPEKVEALTNLTYMSAAKTLVLVRQRCWERDDDIYGGASYTDLPIQQVWYPSDNATVIDDEAGARATRLQDIGDGSGRETSFALWGPDPQQAEPWRRPAILTAAYMTGINAERFCSLTDAERTNEVLRCLEILHPGIRADVAEEEYEDEHGARLRRPLVRHCSWIEQRTPGGGAWPYLAPGAHERYQDLLCAPHPENSPRVFFAGEHLCVLHGWMQGAIQSALEAAMAVMDAPH